MRLRLARSKGCSRKEKEKADELTALPAPAESPTEGEDEEEVVERCKFISFDSNISH